MSVVRSERLYYGVEIEYNDAYKKFYEEEGNWDGPGDYFPEIQTDWFDQMMDSRPIWFLHSTYKNLDDQKIKVKLDSKYSDAPEDSHLLKEAVEKHGLTMVEEPPWMLGLDWN